MFVITLSAGCFLKIEDWLYFMCEIPFKHLVRICASHEHKSFKKVIDKKTLTHYEYNMVSSSILSYKLDLLSNLHESEA